VLVLNTVNLLPYGADWQQQLAITKGMRDFKWRSECTDWSDDMAVYREEDSKGNPEHNHQYIDAPYDQYKMEAFCRIRFYAVR